MRFVMILVMNTVCSTDLDSSLKMFFPAQISLFLSVESSNVLQEQELLTKVFTLEL